MEARKTAQKHTSLILIGKTGNGKSSTGNSILGNRCFKTSGNTVSETKICASEIREFEGRIFQVIDTPGLADTSLDETTGIKLVIDSIEKIITEFPNGFHACLIVLRYGGKFTGEEKMAIQCMKEMFGQSFIEKYCILCITNGDSFENDSEVSGKTFKDWYQEQIGEFQHLLEECKGNIILFNNRLKGKDSDEQTSKLLQIVDSLGGRRYTNEKFEKAKRDREIMLLKANLPNIKEKTMNLIHQLLKDKMEVENTEESLRKEKILKSIQDKVQTKYDDLTKQDQRSGFLSDLMETVKSIISTASVELQVMKKVGERQGKDLTSITGALFALTLRDHLQKLETYQEHFKNEIYKATLLERFKNEAEKSALNERFRSDMNIERLRADLANERLRAEKGSERCAVM